jgi:acetyl esterase/lipase
MFSPRVFIHSFVLLAAVVLRAGEPAVTVLTDVSFLGEGRKEKLDIYLPAERPAGMRSPALVWIHGGGWTGGTKNEARAKNVCTTLAAAGYVALSIDYKLGEGAWPTNLYDCKNAVRFLRARAAEYGVDPDRIAVAGGSAGGHLALMVALTAGRPELAPPPEATLYPSFSDSVRGVINFYGITNLQTRRETDEAGNPLPARKSFTGAAKVYGIESPDDPRLKVASPVTYLARDSVPILTLHGRADTTVDRLQAEELDRVARERGARHELLFLDGVGHTFDLQTWKKKPLPRDLRPVVLEFLNRHL